MSQYNLRVYLEKQSDLIEARLTDHGAPARVTGGTVGPRVVRLFLAPAAHTRLAMIQGHADDLALALTVSSLRISRGEEGVILEFPNPHPRPVTMLKLLEEVKPLPQLTALMGLTDSGVPLLARLSSSAVAHVLVTGAAGAGKTSLLRTMAISLLLSSSPSDIRLLCISVDGQAFGSIKKAPHLLRPPVVAVSEAHEALRSLRRNMNIRDRRQTAEPAVVILIDEILDLVAPGGDAAFADLLAILEQGHDVGIHVIAATRRLASACLSVLPASLFPLRIAGRESDGSVAVTALQGRGDFVVIGKPNIRFQAALIKEKRARAAVAEYLRSV